MKLSDLKTFDQVVEERRASDEEFRRLWDAQCPCRGPDGQGCLCGRWPIEESGLCARCETACRPAEPAAHPPIIDRAT